MMIIYNFHTRKITDDEKLDIKQNSMINLYKYYVFQF